jgi:ParB family transcriptional regulator, chromosome partitioning protein
MIAVRYTYKRAGGHILRDLFQPDHDDYLTDPALLDRLVIAKLEAAAKAIRAEGWKWVTIMPTINHDHLRGLGRVYPECEPPTEEQQAETDALTVQYDALIEEHGEDPPDEIAAELATLSDKIDALSDGTERWLPEDIARAGAIIGIGYGGRLAVERGLLRPEDGRDATYDTELRGRSAPSPAPRPGLSDRLIEHLTAHRTAALRIELASRSELALTAVVHALALPVFFPHESETCLDISLDSGSAAPRISRAAPPERRWPNPMTYGVAGCPPRRTVYGTGCGRRTSQPGSTFSLIAPDVRSTPSASGTSGPRMTACAMPTGSPRPSVST